MKIRGILAGAIALGLSVAPALAQTSQGSSPLTGAKGGTNNAFMQFTGPASSMKTFTLPNVSDTIVLLTQTQTLTNKTLTSPVLTAPTLGVAAATSLAVNGASIGSHALAVVGSSSLAGSLRVPTGSASCISTGNTAPTNPVFEVDCSTASQAAGLKITGAATGGTVAIAATDSGTNANVSLNAKGSGTIAIGNVSTGAVTISRALTLSNALTYGGVTLSNAVSGTGNMVLSTSPVLTTPNLGTPSALVLTNATGLPLSGHASQAAYTFVGNNSGSSAAPTAVDIAALTTKASPAATDYLMISDQAASGAWKKVEVSSISSAGSVSSIAGNTGAFTLGFGLTNSANDIRMRSGAVMGSVFGSYAANTILTNLIPADDTIPTSSEGTQILSVSYTPIVSTSKLRCRFNGTVSNGSADNVVASIFQGTTNIGSQMINITAANAKATFHIEAEYSPGSTSAQTITVRAGGVTTSIAFNGVLGTRFLGGSQAATIVCEEIAP